MYSNTRGGGIKVTAKGVNAWDGAIEFKKAEFSQTARQNSARVVKDLKADVLCTVEIEGRLALENFNSTLLNNRYPFQLAIDGNDERGIDVGLLSKLPIRRIRTHVFDKDAGGRIFSRDCLELELGLPGGKSLSILCNHFKSQGHGNPTTNDARRTKQAKRVAEILQGYNLATDWVVVAGDFNDSLNRPPFTLKPLLTVNNLHDVLQLQFPNDPSARWTYHFKAFEQIDYILVSEPMKNAFRKAGVERRGIFQLGKLTGGAEHEYDTVKSYSDAASDHAGVWAEFGS
ncbi:MAG TPA: endonuclease/exonuclease/phosphatase family protein [Gemmataceae bacterium]|nr:endonuclease/exonuclease/phosphatase family protein [Gemmataceae bacterium]